MKKSKLKKIIKKINKEKSELEKRNCELVDELRKKKQKHPMTLGEFKKFTKDCSDDLVLFTEVQDHYYNGKVLSIDIADGYIKLQNFVW